MILGISGRKGSGKDTLADHLVQNRNAGKLSLADPIKLAAKDWYGFSDEVLWGASHLRDAIDPVTGLSARRVLEVIGTDICRQLHPDTWVNLTMRAANLVLQQNQRSLVVIPDVRFPNELRAIQKGGGKVVRIVRPDLPPFSPSAHASETSLPDSDYVYDAMILNNRGLLEFLQHGDHVVSLLLSQSMIPTATISSEKKAQ